MELTFKLNNQKNIVINSTAHLYQYLTKVVPNIDSLKFISGNCEESKLSLINGVLEEFNFEGLVKSNEKRQTA